MSFSEQLHKLRKRKNINQADLANQLGVKQYVISSWETGRSEPSINQIIRLSEILDVPTDYLLDKPVIIVSSEDEFNKMCKDLSKVKKDKMIKIIKELIEY